MVGLLLCGAGVTSLGCRSAAEVRESSLPSAPRDEASAIERPPAPASRWTGVVERHDAFCGGAALNAAEAARFVHPVANTAFVVLAGDHNTAARPVARFVTDARGRFELPALPPATYCVVAESAQLSAEQESSLQALPPRSPEWEAEPGGISVDRDCLRRLPLQCGAIWEASAPNFSPRVSLIGSRCPWNQVCTQYHGPLPP